MNFGIEEAVKIANYLASQQANRNLTDVEISVLRGSWEKLEYDQIAAQNQYSTSYISQDAAPKLWKLLSSALEEKVKKSNFREALKRCWEEKESASSQDSQHSSKTRRKVDSHSTDSNITDYLEQRLNAQPILPNIYIERPPVEAMCCEALTQPGALVRIKAPKFMGKTLLANKILAQFGRENCPTVNLSFELADRQTHLTDLNKFLRWMCLNITRELGLPDQLDEIWDEEGIGAKVSCTAYFEEYLLTQSDRPLILCLDNVDLLFPHPEVYEDLFGLLRSWYEKARNRPVWKKLRLMIVHATDVYIRLNINQSPFNVGLAVELPDLSVQQVQDFAQKSSIQADDDEIMTLMHWVGGHPYLLEQAFTRVKNYSSSSLASMLAESSEIMEVYRDHLREQWVALQENAELMDAFADVVQSTSAVQLDPVLAYQLQSMGLVRLCDNQVEIRCNLYSEYFKRHFD